MLSVEGEDMRAIAEAIRCTSFRDSRGFLVRIDVPKDVADNLALQALSMAASLWMKRYEPLKEPEVVHLSGALFNPKP